MTAKKLRGTKVVEAFYDDGSKDPSHPSARHLAAAIGVLVAYQCRAGLGASFDPKLLGRAEDDLAAALHDYGLWVKTS